MAEDRNKQAREAFALGQQRQQIAKQIQAAFAAFAGDFAAGKVGVLDRFAVRIKKGDLILWTPPHQLVYEVVDIQPILQPIAHQPIGQIQVVLGLTAPVSFMAQQPAMGVVVVGHQVDKDHATLTTPSGATKDNTLPLGTPIGVDYVTDADLDATPPPEVDPDGDTGN